jgi:hypothetical protein
MDNWPDVVENLGEGLLFLAIVLAFFTDFWDNLSERMRKPKSLPKSPNLNSCKRKGG